ncbi:T9SS type A sorting domain-containing protein [Hugenholtzia roseola]|uniref:T9SS type A sorting domain-containing protein n=1 Tax=Hugenholtzia roseola TaxID=1002 RepID=UPI000412C7AF|nr:T9SS type A sorting domain-containing protein [Hugenholtzia roseola]
MGGESVRFTVRLAAKCASLGFAGNFQNSITVTDQNGYDESVLSPVYNVLAPSLAISNISPTPIAYGAGLPFDRTIEITNNGVGRLANFELQLQTLCGTVNSVSVGTLVGTTVSFAGANFAAIGNNDNFLDPNETISLVLTETISTCTGCTDENFVVSWGCDGATCQTNSRIAQVQPTTERPQITTTLLRGNYPSTCNDSDLITVRFENTSTGTIAGTGIAYDLDFRFGWVTNNNNNNTIPARRNDIEILDFAIGGTPFAPTIAAAADGYQYPTAYAAPVMGLTDEDGDGLFDDLPVGGVVEFTFRVRHNCATTCEADYATQRLKSLVLYNSDQCAATAGNSYSCNVLNDNGDATSVFTLRKDNRAPNANVIPAIIEEGVPVTVSLSMDFEYRNLQCQTDDLYLRIPRIPGYTITNVASFDPCLTVNVDLDITSDPLNYIIRPNLAPFGFTNGINPRTFRRFNDLTLVFNIEMDCSVPGFNPAAPIPYFFEYVCDNNCGCVEQLECGSINFATKNCLNCNDGLLTRDFKMRRTTMGWTDRTKTTLATPNECTMRLDRAMATDIVRFTAEGAVRNSGWDNSFFEITYTTPFSAFDFVSGSATLEYFDASTGTTYNLTLADPVQTIAAGNQRLRYEWGSLIGAAGGFPAGFTFDASDRIEISGDLKVTITNDHPTTPTNLANLRGRFFALTPANVERACNSVREDFQTHRPNIYLNPASFTRNNCGVVDLNIDLVHDTNSGDDYPNEFRNYTHPTEIIINIPPEFEFESNIGRWIGEIQPAPGVATVNEPYTGVITGNTITFTENNWTFLDKTSGNGRWHRLRVRVRPLTCNLPTTPFQTIWRFVDRDYAHDVSDKNLNAQRTRNIDYTIDFHSLSIGLPVGEIDEAFNNFESFEMSITTPLNPNLTSNNVWFAIDHPNIIVDRITDITGAPFNVPVLNYGAGKYWAQVGDRPRNTTRRYRIEYRYTSCSPFSVEVKTAWSCFGYPTDPDNLTCTTNVTTRNMQIDVKPAAILASITPSTTDPVGICDEIDYEVEISNGDLQYLRNLQGTLFFPTAGLTYVSGTGEIRYPNSAAFVPLADPAGAGTTRTWDFNTIIAPFAGTAAFPGVSDANNSLDSSRITIRFKTRLNCDFVSGTVSFRASAQRMCGGTIQTPLLNSPQPSILGAVRPYNTVITYENNDLLIDNCDTHRNLSVNIQNLGLDPTAAQDFYVLDLPPGVAYGGNYTAIENMPAVADLTVLPLGGGATRLRFRLQAGVPNGSRMRFSFDLDATNAACMSPTTMPASTVVEEELFCAFTGTNCPSVLIPTGSTNAANIAIIRPNADLTVTEVYLQWQPAPFGFYQAELTGTILNNGTADLTETLTLAMVCDNNASLSPDAGDFDFGTIQLNVTIPAGGSYNLVSVPFPNLFPNAACPETNGVIVSINQVQNPAQPNEYCLCEAQEFYAAPNIVLPISWLEVAGKEKASYNEIVWTVLESDVASYEVERLVKGNGEAAQWETLTTLLSQSKQSNQANHYAFHHTKPQKIEYYRIKGVENSGKIFYSKVVEVSRNSELESALFQLYPNPTKGEVTLSGTEAADFQILNVLGNTLLEGKVEPNAPLQVKIENLAAGTYFVRFKNAQGEQVLKFVVVQ